MVLTQMQAFYKPLLGLNIFETMNYMYEQCKKVKPTETLSFYK